MPVGMGGVGVLKFEISRTDKTIVCVNSTPCKNVFRFFRNWNLRINSNNLLSVADPDIPFRGVTMK